MELLTVFLAFFARVLGGLLDPLNLITFIAIGLLVRKTWSIILISMLANTLLLLIVTAGQSAIQHPGLSPASILASFTVALFLPLAIHFIKLKINQKTQSNSQSVNES